MTQPPPPPDHEKLASRAARITLAEAQADYDWYRRALDTTRKHLLRMQEIYNVTERRAAEHQVVLELIRHREGVA